MTSHLPARRQFLQTLVAATASLSVGCDRRMRQAFLGPLGNVIDAVKITPFTSPQAAEVDLISHVISRLTWGVTPGLYEQVRALAATPEAAAEKFIQRSADPRNADTLAKESHTQVAHLEALQEPIGELYDYRPKQLEFELTQAAMLRAIHSPNQAYELMVGFWSDHFNIDSSKADCRWIKAYDDRAVIRPHAWGNFAELLRASALSPAMLFYLDGRKNRRSKPTEKPNENYARELLELHTLGVHGGYTQDDVMAVARCLTGWTVKGRDDKLFSMGMTAGMGTVKFLPGQHDDGPKTVLGHQIAAGGGAQDLDDVLEIVTQHPATAQFLATKLCRHFISDDPPAAAVTATAAAFTSSRGNIPTTLGALWRTPEFLTARRTKMKRPLHYLVSMMRALGCPGTGGAEMQRALRRMGHMPFSYPTPEGHSDQAGDWMSTLLARWDFALRLGRGELAPPTWKAATLHAAAGGTPPLLAHLLGRQPTADEAAAIAATPATDQLALALALPDFQLY